MARLTFCASSPPASNQGLKVRPPSNCQSNARHDARRHLPALWRRTAACRPSFNAAIRQSAASEIQIDLITDTPNVASTPPGVPVRCHETERSPAAPRRQDGRPRAASDQQRHNADAPAHARRKSGSLFGRQISGRCRMKHKSHKIRAGRTAASAASAGSIPQILTWILMGRRLWPRPAPMQATPE